MEKLYFFTGVNEHEKEINWENIYLRESLAACLRISPSKHLLSPDYVLIFASDAFILKLRSGDGEVVF